LNALFSVFAENLLPVLIVAGLGYLLQRLFPFDVRTIARLALYVCVPALVFQLLYRTDVSAAEMLRMVGFAATMVALIAVLAFLVGKVLRLDPAGISALVLATAFMNSGNFGLSVNRLAFGETGLALASVFFVTTSLLNNSVGIMIARAGRESPARSIQGLLRVPAVYMIVLAIALRWLGWPVPSPVSRSVEILASAAIPLMLLQLGMQLSRIDRPARPATMAATVILRLLVPAGLGWLLAPLFGLDGVARQAAILEASMPTAVLSSIIATEFDTESSLVGSAVLLTTLLSPLTLTPLILLLSR
jgi:predicted permease